MKTKSSLSSFSNECILALELLGGLKSELISRYFQIWEFLLFIVGEKLKNIKQRKNRSVVRTAYYQASQRELFAK